MEPLAVLACNACTSAFAIRIVCIPACVLCCACTSPFNLAEMPARILAYFAALWVLSECNACMLVISEQHIFLYVPAACARSMCLRHCNVESYECRSPNNTQASMRTRTQQLYRQLCSRQATLILAEATLTALKRRLVHRPPSQQDRLTASSPLP